MFVTKEIDEFLNVNDPYFPRANAAITFGTFCAGHLLTVTRKMSVEADLEKMVDTDEVWIMCFRHPRPGGRLLGRFADKDIFVGTEIDLRENLAGDNYKQAADRVISSWDSLTNRISPVRSNDLNDYLGYTFRDVDLGNE